MTRKRGASQGKGAPRRKGRARRNRRRGRWAWWLGLAVLAGAVVATGMYLVRRLPRAPQVTAQPPVSDPRAELEALLGMLDAAGVRVRVVDRDGARELARRLAGVVAKKTDGAVSLEAWSPISHALLGGVVVGGVRYPLRLEWEQPAAREEPRLAVVIDDMGQNLGREKQFLDLPVAITPSVLPHLRYTADVMALAKERGREFLLHLPMEPQGYPTQNPGKGAILEAMGETQVRAAVRALLVAVPGAVGANNHMGSRLTELRRPMTWVLEELRAEGVFFLDSVTTGKSVGADLARELGLDWARRDVFLDNVQEVAAVAAQLDRAVALAKANGTAVAIGHPHPATLKALSQWLPRLRAAGVHVVPLRQLVRHGEGA